MSRSRTRDSKNKSYAPNLRFNMIIIIKFCRAGRLSRLPYLNNVVYPSASYLSPHTTFNFSCKLSVTPRPTVVITRRGKKRHRSCALGHLKIKRKISPLCRGDSVVLSKNTQAVKDVPYRGTFRVWLKNKRAPSGRADAGIRHTPRREPRLL